MTSTRAKFTRRDYERLPEGLLCELIDGELVKEPSPTFGHQRAALRLIARLLELVGVERCIFSPIDLFLDDLNVFQPDVAVFATPLPRELTHIPIPAIVIEVSSPSTVVRDRDTKTRAYLAHGVGEVWLLDPDSGAIRVHTADGVRAFEPDDDVVSSVLPEVVIRGRDMTR